MGDLRGFMKYPRQSYGKEPVADRLKHYNEFLQGSASRRTADARARAAWIAACRSATPAARWAISSPTGTIWCIATTGASALESAARHE